MSELRLAAAGLGKMGLLHAALLSRQPGARLVAACDPDGGRRAAARGFGLAAELFSDAQAMLAKADADALIVAVPTQGHESLARAALARGLHVFVEKPVALGGAAARALAAEAARAGRTAASGYFMRFHPLFARAAALVPGLGEPLRYEACVEHSERLDSPAGWLFDAARGGGVLRNPGLHLLDWLLLAMGPARPLSARLERRVLKSADDYAQARLAHASAEGLFVADWTAPGRPSASYRARVEGPLGELLVEPERLSVRYTDGRARVEERPAGGVGFDLAPQGAFGAAYWAQDAEFVAACRAGRPVPNGLLEAAAVEELADAVAAAAGAAHAA